MSEMPSVNLERTASSMRSSLCCDLKLPEGRHPAGKVGPGRLIGQECGQGAVAQFQAVQALQVVRKRKVVAVQFAALQRERSK